MDFLRSTQQLSNIPRPRQLMIATDAAALQGMFGYSFIATNGKYGLAVHNQPRRIVGASTVMIAELRGIYFAITSMKCPRHTVILCDNEGALRHIADWQAGRLTYPPGYTLERRSGRTAGLAVMAHYIAKHPRAYQFQWVKGHAGHPLNEAADKLAKLALFTEIGPAPRPSPEQTLRRAKIIARHALKHHQAQNPS